MADAFEIIHRTSDRLEAEMVADLLVSEGIDARLIGTTNAALIGVAPHILRLRIEVPAEAAAQARELVAGILGADAQAAAAAAEAEAMAGTAATAGAEATTSAAATAGTAADAASRPLARPADGGEPVAGAPRPRHPLLAAGAAFVLPGGSHVYARHPWTGLILAAGFLVALVVMIAGARRHAVVAAGASTLGALLLADLLAGQAAVRRANHGVRPTRARQAARGLVLVALAAVVGAGIGSRVPPPKPRLRPLLPGAPGLQRYHDPTSLDLPVLPPELEEILRRRGSASQPGHAPLLWPRRGLVPPGSAPAPAPAPPPAPAP